MSHSKQAKIEKQFIEAYDSYADALFKFCFFRVYDREHAKNMVQEVFTKVWDYIRQGNHIKNLKAFLYTTARNLIIDYTRRKKETSLEKLQDEGFNPCTPPLQIQNAEMQAVIETINKLEEKYREVIVLRHIHGFSPKEIAKMLGETENAVSVRIHRGLHLLRELLNH